MPCPDPKEYHIRNRLDSLIPHSSTTGVTFHPYICAGSPLSAFRLVKVSVVPRSPRIRWQALGTPKIYVVLRNLAMKIDFSWSSSHFTLTIDRTASMFRMHQDGKVPRRWTNRLGIAIANSRPTSGRIAGGPRNQMFSRVQYGSGAF